MLPGTSATVLEAFATVGGSPASTKAGSCSYRWSHINSGNFAKSAIRLTFIVSWPREKIQPT